MPKQADKAKVGMPFEIQTMLLFAVAGALLAGASFQVIVWYPLPVAVAPYFEDSLFPTGATWGFFVGGFVGWLIGHLTDESRFDDASYE